MGCERLIFSGLKIKPFTKLIAQYGMNETIKLFLACKRLLLAEKISPRQILH